MRAIDLFAISATLFGVARADATPPAKHPDAKTFLDHASLLAPIQVDSLSIVPIVADQKPPDDDLLVLDEAMREKLVRITEFDEGNVNSLTLVNKADKPVFLLAGEVIIGGKQDRIIGRNTIISSNTKLEVPVFCVEHGRWDDGPKEFRSANALAHGRLRGRANYASQQAVWNEVSAKNRLAKSQSKTDTYRGVAARQNDATYGEWEKRVDAGMAKIAVADRDRLIGFAVALNGKVATIDVFGSPKLFDKLEKKLVRSYVAEAVDVKVDAKAKPPTMGDVKTFVAEAEKAASAQQYENAYSGTDAKISRELATSKVRYKAAPAPKKKDGDKTHADVAAEPPAPIYYNYQALE
jgi:hypothetical protein